MASEYEPKTDVYGEVYDLLQKAKQSLHPWGAKKLSKELCTLFMKDIAEGDAKLFSLAGVGKDFRQEGDQVKVSADDKVDDLHRKVHELLMLRVDLNLMHMKRLVCHADRLMQMLTTSYI